MQFNSQERLEESEKKSVKHNECQYSKQSTSDVDFIQKEHEEEKRLKVIF